MTIKEKIGGYVAEFNIALNDFFKSGSPSLNLCNKKILEVIKYATGDGKRLRPVLMRIGTEIASKISGKEPDKSVLERFQIALELIHCFSLVHDDLPAMDNDLLRHGKPSVHAKFGEATAILAGDMMLNLSHLIMLELEQNEIATKATAAISAGAVKMINGQCLDMKITSAELVEIYSQKTGALFVSALSAGAVLAGSDADTLTLFEKFGNSFGIAFQLADDIADSEYIDIEEHKKLLNSTMETAAKYAKSIGENGKDLVEFLDYVVKKVSQK